MHRVLSATQAKPVSLREGPWILTPSSLLWLSQGLMWAFLEGSASLTALHPFYDKAETIWTTLTSWGRVGVVWQDFMNPTFMPSRHSINLAGECPETCAPVPNSEFPHLTWKSKHISTPTSFLCLCFFSLSLYWTGLSPRTLPWSL